MIRAQNISYSSGDRKILHTASLSFEQPEMVVILGPNGAGKSTLLQVLAGLYTPSTGTVAYNGTDVLKWKVNELAKQRSFLHQQNSIFGSFTVSDVVEMGRYPYFDVKPTQEDLDMIMNSIDEMGFSQRAEQPYQTLSGGEQQRIQFARAILQLQENTGRDLNNKVLFLDEPLNNLDMQYQYLLMEQAREKIVNKGGIVIAVLHDINMAYQFADRILILKEGNLVIDEPVEQALNPEVLETIFDIEVKKIRISDTEAFFHTKAKKKAKVEGSEINKVQSYI